MSGVLKYIAVSLVFHGVAAAAVLSAGVFTNASTGTEYVEVTRICLSAPVGGGAGYSVNQNRRFDGSPPASSKPAREEVRGESLLRNDKHGPIVHHNNALRYIVPDLTGNVIPESEDDHMIYPDGSVPCTTSTLGDKTAGRAPLASSVPGGGESAAEGDGAYGAGVGYISSGFGQRGGPGIVRLAQPVYPRRALSMNKGGSVVLRLVIEKDGSLRSVAVEKDAGYGFDEAALDAARKSRFSPAVKDGRPVGCIALLPYRFEPAAH